MANSKQIVYLSQAQYAELVANGTITVNGVTVTYDENDIYVTPQAEPITDVRVNGSSIAANGVADIPIAQNSPTAPPGLVKVNWGGLDVTSSGFLRINPATDVEIKSGTSHFKPIVPVTQDKSVFYGLAKAAGDTTQSASSNAVGQYTDDAKAAIQSMIGIGETVILREYTQLGSDMSLIEIPLPSKYRKVFVRFQVRLNNADNDLSNGSAPINIWLGDDSYLAQDFCVYTSCYIRQSDTFMIKAWFDIDFPFVERYCTDTWGANNWSIGANVKNFGGSYGTEGSKLTSYPMSLYICPYERNKGYLFKANSYLGVYAVL